MDQLVKDKAKELKGIFNNDIRSCIRVCDAMIKDNLNVNFYLKVKECLTTPT